MLLGQPLDYTEESSLKLGGYLLASGNEVLQIGILAQSERNGFHGELANLAKALSSRGPL